MPPAYLSVLLVLLLLYEPCSNQQTPQFFYRCTAEGWVNNGDTCYHVLATQTKWKDGLRLCRKLGAEYAYVDDKDDMKALADAALIRNAPTVWVKGSNQNDRNKFVWYDPARTPVDSSLTPWAPGFPVYQASQFLYLKIDLERRTYQGLASSLPTMKRQVACMMPARKFIEDKQKPRAQAGTEEFDQKTRKRKKAAQPNSGRHSHESSAHRRHETQERYYDSKPVVEETTGEPSSADYRGTSLICFLLSLLSTLSVVFYQL